ncbi:hypothetical protein EVAR_64994_1 [Eumeta japonica]|uniref:Uncharacterized protein n=1 Tax=Eumeta variegata TaxID=151549 RepID=A0A4C1ZUT3_EUMVA|nr:hypothetical protein EVAR_64994_1 [Eumeta japonica]
MNFISKHDKLWIGPRVPYPIGPNKTATAASLVAEGLLVLFSRAGRMRLMTIPVGEGGVVGLREGSTARGGWGKPDRIVNPTSLENTEIHFTTPRRVGARGRWAARCRDRLRALRPATITSWPILTCTTPSGRGAIGSRTFALCSSRGEAFHVVETVFRVSARSQSKVARDFARKNK